MASEEKVINKLDFTKSSDQDPSTYVELFSKCFPHFQFSSEWFNWYNFSNPLGENRNYVILDKEEIVGMLGGLTIKVKLNGKIVDGILLTNGAIHPKYKGNALFVKLEKYLLEEEKKLGTSIVLGIPNKNIFRSHLKAGMKVLGNLDFIGKYTFKNRKHNCVKIKSFDDSFNKMQDTINRKSNFIVCKDSDFLNWRYFQRPDKEYMVFATLDGNKPQGWIVVKHFNDNGYLKTHIVDIAAVDFNAFNNLINQAGQLAINRHELNVWQIDNSLYYDWFKEMDFIPTINKNVLIYYGLKKKLVNSNWWFTLGDNDVY
jgi:hypothetical protein